MIVKQVFCQRRGHRYEVEILDRRDPDERARIGSSVCCVECRMQVVEPTGEGQLRRSQLRVVRSKLPCFSVLGTTLMILLISSHCADWFVDSSPNFISASDGRAAS